MKRIYHTWDRWECYPAGFYEDRPPKGMSQGEAVEAYRDFLRDPGRFEAGLRAVIDTWPHSCEHYLSNANMNRIAWLGQASMCQATGVPACFRGGFNTLTDTQKDTANRLALRYLNLWLERRGEEPLTLDAAKCRTEVELY